MTFGKRPLLVVAGVLVALALGIMCPAPGLAAAEAPGLFTDVSPGDPNVIFIRYLKKSGLASGRPDGTFGPREPLTRAGALCLITGAEAGGGGGQAASLFSDVPPDHWAAGAIGRAGSMGLARGYQDGTFFPDSPVTRAEAVSILFNWAGQKSFPEPTGKTPGVPDGHWAAGAMAASLQAGLISADDGVRPDEAITRGDFSRALALTIIQKPGRGSIALKGVLNAEKGMASVESGGETTGVEGPLSVLPGMTIKTVSGGEAEIVFEDGSSLQMGENTILTILKMAGIRAISPEGDPISSIDSLQVRLETGKLIGALSSPHMFNINIPGRELTGSRPGRPHLLAMAHGIRGDLLRGLMAWEGTEGPDQTGPGEAPWYIAAGEKRVRVTVDMPWGVGGIRGTFWTNEVTQQSQSTNVLRGEAVVGAGGKTVTLKGGQSTVISSRGAPPEQPRPMSRSEAREWVDRSDWVVRRARIIEKSLPVNSVTLPVILPPGKKPAEKGTPEKRPEKYFDLPSELIKSVNSAAKAAGMDVTVKLDDPGRDQYGGQGNSVRNQSQGQGHGQGSSSKDSNSKDSNSKDSNSKDSNSKDSNSKDSNSKKN